MVLDSEDQRKSLLALIGAATFQGKDLAAVVAMHNAVTAATIAEVREDAPDAPRDAPVADAPRRKTKME